MVEGRFCIFKSSYYNPSIFYKVHFWCCLVCTTTIFSVHLWTCSIANGKLENWPQNLRFCFFDLHFSQILSPFAAFTAPTSMPCKVHFWYCFACTTIFSLDLWTCSVPSRRLASNWWFLYLWPTFCQNLGTLRSFQSSYDLSIPCKVHFCIVLFAQPFSGPFMELQYSKSILGMSGHV